jgi:hypothetical protein
MPAYGDLCDHPNRFSRAAFYHFAEFQISLDEGLDWVGYGHSSRSEATRHKFLEANATSNDAGFTDTRSGQKSAR